MRNERVGDEGKREGDGRDCSNTPAPVGPYANTVALKPSKIPGSRNLHDPS